MPPCFAFFIQKICKKNSTPYDVGCLRGSAIIVRMKTKIMTAQLELTRPRFKLQIPNPQFLLRLLLLSFARFARPAHALSAIGYRLFHRARPITNTLGSKVFKDKLKHSPIMRPYFTKSDLIIRANS